MSTFAPLRLRMVEEQLRSRGIRDSAVLEAMKTIPRDAFLPADLADVAYRDAPLPIGSGQTISQPYVVALMASALCLGPEDRVLEVGTGSGYAAAVLSLVASHVYTIERHECLAAEAERRFRFLGLPNISVRRGDGTLGWPEAAPFNGIMVSASGPCVPPELRAQLAVGGRLVIPVSSGRLGGRRQRLSCIRRLGADRFRERDLGPVRFVPLVGEGGWPEGCVAEMQGA